MGQPSLVQLQVSPVQQRFNLGHPKDKSKMFRLQCTPNQERSNGPLFRVGYKYLTAHGEQPTSRWSRSQHRTYPTLPIPLRFKSI